MDLTQIIKTATMIGLVGWGLWVEIRLQKANDANEVLKRRLDDELIQKSVNSLTDNAARDELSKNLGSGAI
jgi:hypothetical protein